MEAGEVIHKVQRVMFITVSSYTSIEFFGDKMLIEINTKKNLMKALKTS